VIGDPGTLISAYDLTAIATDARVRW
jgi:hypothetical protein